MKIKSITINIDKKTWKKLKKIKITYKKETSEKVLIFHIIKNKTKKK